MIESTMGCERAFFFVSVSPLDMLLHMAHGKTLNVISKYTIQVYIKLSILYMSSCVNFIQLIK